MFVASTVLEQEFASRRWSACKNAAYARRCPQVPSSRNVTSTHPLLVLSLHTAVISRFDSYVGAGTPRTGHVVTVAVPTGGSENNWHISGGNPRCIALPVLLSL